MRHALLWQVKDSWRIDSVSIAFHAGQPLCLPSPIQAITRGTMVKKRAPRRESKGARLRRRRLLVYSAGSAILADLRDGLHQMSIDKWIILSIANNAHRILPALNFFNLAEHHCTQQDDAAIGTG
jgi:hypothetical protein